jgi:hypothetical protein
MIFTLHKFRHYLLANPFTFFIGHQALKYLVNKPVHQGNIFRWLLLFQELVFDLIIQLGKNNVQPDHLSRLATREESKGIDGDLPKEHLFRVEVSPKNLEDIENFLEEGKAPEDLLTNKQKSTNLKSCTFHNHKWVSL